MSRICIATLIGLPGSGKTTLCKTLKQNPQRDVAVAHLQYDAVIPDHVTRDLLADSGQWRAARQAVLQAVESLLQHGLSGDVTRDDTGDTHLTDIMDDVTQALQSQQKLLLLVDDNMYYRSMRYEYCQLARRLTAGFCQLYLPADVTLCRHRNAQRPAPVPDHVITRMNDLLEAPSGEGWERNTVTITPDDLEPVWAAVCDALAQPCHVVANDTDQQTADRVTCSESFLHQADQVLRQQINRHIAAARQSSSLSPIGMKTLAQSLSTQKKKILDDLRGGHIHIPANLNFVCDLSRDPSDKGYKFVAGLLSLDADTVPERKILCYVC